MDDKKRYDCPDGFAVESNDEDEVVKHVKMHASEKDHMEASEDDIKAGIKTL